MFRKQKYSLKWKNWKKSNFLFPLHLADENGHFHKWFYQKLWRAWTGLKNLQKFSIFGFLQHFRPVEWQKVVVHPKKVVWEDSTMVLDSLMLTQHEIAENFKTLAQFYDWVYWVKFEFSGYLGRSRKWRYWINHTRSNL